MHFLFNLLVIRYTEAVAFASSVFLLLTLAYPEYRSVFFEFVTEVSGGEFNPFLLFIGFFLFLGVVIPLFTPFTLKTPGKFAKRLIIGPLVLINILILTGAFLIPGVELVTEGGEVLDYLTFLIALASFLALVRVAASLIAEDGKPEQFFISRKSKKKALILIAFAVLFLFFASIYFESAWFMAYIWLYPIVGFIDYLFREEVIDTL